jgi:hypothetical protein
MKWANGKSLKMEACLVHSPVKAIIKPFIAFSL